METNPIQAGDYLRLRRLALYQQNTPNSRERETLKLVKEVLETKHTPVPQSEFDIRDEDLREVEEYLKTNPTDASALRNREILKNQNIPKVITDIRFIDITGRRYEATLYDGYLVSVHGRKSKYEASHSEWLIKKK